MWCLTFKEFGLHACALLASQSGQILFGPNIPDCWSHVADTPLSHWTLGACSLDEPPSEEWGQCDSLSWQAVSLKWTLEASSSGFACRSLPCKQLVLFKGSCEPLHTRLEVMQRGGPCMMLVSCKTLDYMFFSAVELKKTCDSALQMLTLKYFDIHWPT